MSSSEDRKRSLRFTLASDILLLREVSRHRPWASPHGKIRDTWEQIATAVTALINEERDANEPPARVDHGASKRRYDVLMEAYAKDELKSMRAKGSAELYLQREELLTDLSLQLSQFQENKAKAKRPSSSADAAASVFAGLKHPRTETTAPGAGSATVAGVTDGFADLKRQALASVPLVMPTPLVAPATAPAPAPSSASRASLDAAVESRDKLRARELELSEKRLELERLRFESEREERAAIVASLQANTSLLLRLVERLDQAAAANASAMNGASMGTFLGRQPL